MTAENGTSTEDVITAYRAFTDACRPVMADGSLRVYDIRKIGRAGYDIAKLAIHLAAECQRQQEDLARMKRRRDKWRTAAKAAQASAKTGETQ